MFQFWLSHVLISITKSTENRTECQISSNLFSENLSFSIYRNIYIETIDMKFRKNLGDLTDLKRSIKELGLIHPIVKDIQAIFDSPNEALKKEVDKGLTSIDKGYTELKKDARKANIQKQIEDIMLGKMKMKNQFIPMFYSI
jgi:hypothetical protein